MSDDFALGLLVGMVALGLLLAATHRTYRQTLLHIADTEGCEKLPNGSFYYIVREDVYNDLQAQKRVLASIRADHCAGESEWAQGVNAACDNHRAAITAKSDSGITAQGGV
jgi:hypothetical protein